jgi:SpoVK/Ycf46/Vps4 family AAA+-type ATPase
VIDAFGEAVIWLDEIEKAFAGTKNSGETDGGTSASMFGHFLTWLQETKTPVLVMATANDISKLPPEFIRAGRFDATFFVDLPTAEERREVLTIMNQRYGTDVPLDKAHDLNDYTGAEIEQLVKDSLFDGYETALEQLVPLARTMPEEIKKLQKWASTRARLANTPVAKSQDSRRIRTETIGGEIH